LEKMGREKVKSNSKKKEYKTRGDRTAFEFEVRLQKRYMGSKRDTQRNRRGR